MGESKEKKDEKIKKFESLAPKPVDPKSISIYLQALREGLDDIYVKNLAVTGSYGSGKSSIIDSFQNKYKNHFTFLNISLAEFDWEVVKNQKELQPPENSTEEGDSKSQGKRVKNFEKLIELSILQQIFYRVKPSEVPDSKLKRIRNISKNEIFGISASIITWLISSYALVKFNYVESLNPSNWHTTYKFDWYAFLFFFISIFGLFFFLIKIIRWLFNAKITRVNVKGVELGGIIDESILNKHLDEILYFFERTSYDVVVIEDLDRQEELQIFTKLREINYLLNNSKQVITKKRSKITFIYAVRDDILKEKDRTKFFDLVIPVIPFINSYNSNEKLREKLLDEKNKDLSHPLTEDFIDDVSLYIDDMRLLLNICNEYEVYKENLNKNLIQNNILALVVYKNMRPKDFVKLHNRKGSLFSLLSRTRKNKIVESIVESIDAELLKLRGDIEIIEREHLQDARELNAIYLYEITKEINTAHKPHGLFIGDESVPLSEFEEHFYFQEIQKSSPLKYTYNDGYNNAKISSTFEDIEKRVSSKLTYGERVSNILKKNEGEINQIEQQINNLESKKVKTKNWNLESIFKEFKTDKFLTVEEKSDNLMLYFLRNGFIDENYENYISYFYEVSLSRGDNEFLIAVTSESPLSYDFEITNKKNVVNRIQPRYYEKMAILNFDLVSFILNNKNSYKSRFKSIFTFLSSNEGDMDLAREKFYFINSYLEKFPLEEKNSNKNNPGKTNDFLNELIHSWKDLWGFIKSSSGVSNKDKKTIFNYILSVATEKSIKLLNVNNSLSRYIESSSDFLSIPLKSYQQKFATVIQILNIKFSKLDESKEETKKLFDFVYENNHYKINDYNINLMMQNYGLQKGEKLKTRFNFTDILNSTADKLIIYIEDKINEYVSYTNQIEDAYEDEKEEAIVRVYNNKKLKEKSRQEYLGKQTTKITDLSKIDEESDYANFLELLKIEPNWNNVSLYFFISDNKIDDILVSFLNNEANYSVLSSHKISAFEKNKVEDLIKNLSLAILKCDELTLASYVELLKSIPTTHRYWSKITFEKLSHDKVQHLIDRKFLAFSESNFKKIVDNYTDLLIEFLIIHQHDFVSKYNEEIYVWTTNHKEEFFESTDIQIESKVRVFEEFEKSDVVSNPSLSGKICDVLATYGYDKLDFEYLKSFFSNSKSVENRIKLFNLNHHGLDNSELLKLVELLPYPYRKISERQKKPKIDKSTTNLDFVEILKGKRLISSYKILDSYIRVVARY